MKLPLRILGVVVLALALMNASAGLCFCHRGLISPAAPQTSGGCCHAPGETGRTAVTSGSSCCQIESAESAATPLAPVQLAPPTALAAAIAVEPPVFQTLPSVARVLPGASPPLFVLRV